MSQTILLLLLKATAETCEMVGIASLIAIAVGLPLGILLYATRSGNILTNRPFNQVLSVVINITRSIPFIILMIAVIPFTRFIVGSSIGTAAAIVPLSLAAIPFVARVSESALLEVHQGLIEAAMAMGATPMHIISKVLLPESLPSLINGLTLTVVNLVGYSAMAGAVGGGGLGDLAIRYGYQRFDASIMLLTIVLMVALVQLIQSLGDGLTRWFSFRKV